jgi:hypothetical protein
MNKTTNGYYDSGKFVAVAHRTELASENHQRRLAQAANERRQFVCGCQRRLTPVKTAHGGWTLRCDPEENFLHAPGCFARTDGETGRDGLQRPRTVFIPNILCAPGRGDSTLPGAAQNEEGTASDSAFRADHPRYGTLTQLVQTRLEIATMRALRRMNPPPATYRGNHLRAATQQEILWEFLGQLSEPVFSNGRSVFDAASSEDLEVCWGVTTSPIVAQLKSTTLVGRESAFSVPSYWSEGGEQHDSRSWLIPPITAQTAGGKVTAFGRTIEPPYFFFLTATADHRVARLVIVPVASAESSLLCIESQPERTLVTALLAEKLALLKPNTGADFALLGHRFWPGDTSQGRGYLPRRPDLIVFCYGVSIIQLLGSRDQEYLAGVERSLEELRAHLQHPDVRIQTLAISDTVGPALDRVIQGLKKGLGQTVGVN